MGQVRARIRVRARARIRPRARVRVRVRVRARVSSACRGWLADGGWWVRRRVGRSGADGAGGVGGEGGVGGVGGAGGRAKEAVLHSSRLTLGLSLDTFFAAALHSGSSDLQWPHLEDSAGPIHGSGAACRAVLQPRCSGCSLDAAAAAWMRRLWRQLLSGQRSCVSGVAEAAALSMSISGRTTARRTPRSCTPALR